MQGSNSIKPDQLALIVFITQTGTGIIMLPSELARTTEHDGWISLLITGFISAIVGGLIISLMHRYQRKNIYEINRFLFGKVIAMGLNTVLILYLLVVTVLCVSILIIFINITLLPRTPTWVLIFFTMLPNFYLVWQGMKDMSRFLYISVINYFIIALLPLLLIKEYRWTFLLPVGEAGLSGILNGIKPAFFSFIGLELVAFFHPYVTNDKKETKWYIGAIFTTAVFYISYVVISTVILGENFLKVFAVPFFNLARIYHAPIIERLDLYVIALWYIPMACSLRSYIFACFDGIQKVYGLKKSKLLYILFFFLIGFLSSLPDSINSLIKCMELVTVAGIGVCGFLILCLFLSFVRRKGVCVK